MAKQTETQAKTWTRPEVVRLGKIQDVGGPGAAKSQGQGS